MNKNDWFTIIMIILIVISIIIGTFTYYKEIVNECTANPLIYGAKKLSTQFGYEFYGVGRFLVPPNHRTITVFFNSKNLTVEYPEY